MFPNSTTDEGLFPCKARLGDFQNPINTQSSIFLHPFFPSSRRILHPFHSSHHFSSSLVSLSTPHITFSLSFSAPVWLPIISFPKRIFPICLFLGFLFFGNLTKKIAFFRDPLIGFILGV